MFLWWPGKNCHVLAEKLWIIHHIHQALHLWISIYFGLYRSFSMEKISIPWKTVKGTWNSSLLKKIKSFGKMKLWSCLKNHRKYWNKTVNMLFNKVLGGIEKCVFYFYLKTEETFWPTQYFCIPRINLTWSWCIILLIGAEFCLLIFCWGFSFASVFMRDIGL